jgi:hypothetical protein
MPASRSQSGFVHLDPEADEAVCVSGENRAHGTSLALRGVASAVARRWQSRAPNEADPGGLVATEIRASLPAGTHR